MEVEALLEAERVHVCTTPSRSGIAAYAQDFHRLVLEPEGYVLAEPTVVRAFAGRFSPETRFHIQLGVFQHAERRAMSSLISHGHQDVEATVHDPPFVSFPYFQTGSEFLMRLSRGFDWYLHSFGLQRRALTRLKRVFVLSEVGRHQILDIAPKANVITIPHLIRPEAIWPPQSPLGQALLFFGFIGPGKGLEYALELHRAVRALRPHTHMHVIGQAHGSAGQRYLAKLKAEYSEDVTFHGYVEDEELNTIFAQAAHVILPYKQYSHVVPTSGSAIHALRRGRIVWASGVNAIPELVNDDQNGFILTMDIAADSRRLAAVLSDDEWTRRVSNGARQTALQIAAYPYRRYFQRGPDL